MAQKREELKAQEVLEVQAQTEPVIENPYAKPAAENPYAKHSKPKEQEP